MISLACVAIVLHVMPVDHIGGGEHWCTLPTCCLILETFETDGMASASYMCAMR
jgi:hypothetical protein